MPTPASLSTPARQAVPVTPNSTPKSNTKTTNTPTTPLRTGPTPPSGITPAINQITIQDEEESNNPGYKTKYLGNPLKSLMPAPKTRMKGKFRMLTQLGEEQGTWRLTDLPKGREAI
ncbi:hypothetical protein M407DRAFT_27906 [Tulasnella calospora MUT 4182]|uniref:Uncharacterized protein n=1 Tax=Tulasnella calospora MUT 4182 TaxID=1051891 RepID=A0A0C3QBM8_9AGAM|nr:hypothetical protein M407DRAFT_27906 [Tulasnella calospora MUT 4182]